MRDDRFKAGLNATLNIGSGMFKILFAIFVPRLTTPDIKVITKLNMAHQALSYSTSSHCWPLCLRLYK
jgi:hypothetical protein